VSVADPADPRPPLNVLHVGKTGGTALKQALIEHQDVSVYQLLLRGHEATLADVPVGEKFMFLIRDPVSRFVSAFNGRRREDRPRYYYPWREEERIAFALFETADELAASLSSDDATRRMSAESAMRGIGHLNTHYSFWFGGEASFRARLDDLFFIGLQDRLDADFERLKEMLGLPTGTRLPRDPIAAHRGPREADSQLGVVARSNLEQWYADDLSFFELCRQLTPAVNAVKA